MERCISVLTEQCAGKWPFWLSPRQIMVVSVVSAAAEYVDHIHHTLYGEGFECDKDTEGDTVQKKIRNAQLAQYNFILGTRQNFPFDFLALFFRPFNSRIWDKQK